MHKINIKNLSFEQIRKYLESIEEKPFRANQILEWIYKKGAQSFDEMKNLPRDLRKRLSQQFTITNIVQTRQRLVSVDGTTKFLFKLADGEKIETVLIPAKTRVTVCVSTQAGCKFGCRFCASGIGGWKRNLDCAEILEQILEVKRYVVVQNVIGLFHNRRTIEDQNNDLSLQEKRPEYFDFPCSSNCRKVNKPLEKISHIVFMGTGEPLDNYDNVLKSIRIINSDYGLNIAARRITISTCGLIPQIRKLSKEGIQIELAVSLHGYNDRTRWDLMPINKRYSIQKLIDACREYAKITKRQITFEYILIKDVTCSKEAARSLGKMLKGFICKLNLIPCNRVFEFDYIPPSRNDVFAFKKELSRQGIHSTIRSSRGQDVAAACGQLRHSIKMLRI